MPDGDALGDEQDVGLDAPVLDRPHLPGAAGARLDLVGDEQDAVLGAQLAQALEEAVLGDDVAALALDRLDDDRGDLVAGISRLNSTSSNHLRSSTLPNGAW